MAKVFDILEVRVQKTHQFDNGIRIALALFFVFQAHQVLDHLLDVAPVFTHHQVIPRGVIFHTHLIRKTNLQEKA